MRQTEMNETVPNLMLNHPWYLTEEVVVIVVFDADVKEDTPFNGSRTCIDSKTRIFRERKFTISDAADEQRTKY